MKLAARIGIILLGIIALLIVVLAIVGVVNVRRPFPDTDTTLTLPGLEDEVNVYRDENGIPHIYAQNEHDLFLAQGYVHAQDRFWQMEFWRHVSLGRISEIAGEATVSSDTFIRTMGWNRIAEESLAYYESEAPEMLTIMEAYSEGVNAYIDEQGDNISLNYTILGLVNEKWEIEPWEPLHTIAWAVVMADDLGGNWSQEIERANLIKALVKAPPPTCSPFTPMTAAPSSCPPTPWTLNSPTKKAKPFFNKCSRSIGPTSTPTLWVVIRPMAFWAAVTMWAATTGSSAASIPTRECRCWPTIPI